MVKKISFPDMLSFSSTASSSVLPALVPSLHGVLSLLKEVQQPPLVLDALRAIDDQMSVLYFEVALHEPQLEILTHHPNADIKHRASLVLSKLHFYLQQYDRALAYGLQSGSRFLAGSDDSLYGQTMTGCLVDHYLATHDARVEPMVRDLALAAHSLGDCESALALAVEARRPDLTLELLADASLPLLAFALELLLQHSPSSSTTTASSPEDDQFEETCIQQICHRQLTMASSVDLGVLVACYQQCRDDILASPVVTEDQRCQLRLSFELSDVVRFTRLIFQSHRNQTDLLLLERIKAHLNPSLSLHHQAMTAAHALMQCGTTNDDFLRRDLPWFSLGTNWAKFTGVASLGVVHHGQRHPLQLLQAFLPAQSGANSAPSSEYSEGGALMALGLIGRHQYKAKMETEESFNVETSQVESLLMNMLTNSSEVVQHGACLGLGLWSLGAGTPAHLDAVKIVLYADSAVSGEAAALALGLLSYGRHRQLTDPLNELAEYAKETQHEKISRALGVAFALVYAETGVMDDFVSALVHDDGDAIARYGGALCVGAAFANSADARALQLLLRLAVTDPSDDVRRVSAAALGLVIGFDRREELLHLLPLLLQSFNPHARYGAALALGMAFAGTGDERALEALKPLTRDLVDMVRQGALQALALCLQQQPDSKCRDMRRTLERAIASKYEDPLVKYGAVVAQGLLDVGGRNCVFTTLSGSKRVGGGKNPVAGALLFLHSWFWYPLLHCVCLSVVPTAFLGVMSDTYDLYPRVYGTLHSPSGDCAYPAMLKPTEGPQAPKPLASAILSANKRRKTLSPDDKPLKDDPKTESKTESTNVAIDDAVKGTDIKNAQDPDVNVKGGEQMAMQVDDPQTMTPVCNFERVPLGLGSKFALPQSLPGSANYVCPPFDPFGLHWLPVREPTNADGTVSYLVFEAWKSEPFSHPSNNNNDNQLKKSKSSEIKAVVNQPAPKPFKFRPPPSN